MRQVAVGVAAIGATCVIAGCGAGRAHVAATTPPPTRTVVVTVTTHAPAKRLPTLKQALSQTTNAPPSVPAPTDGQDTSLTTQTDDGAVVELDDGSVWSIDSGDDISNWSDGDSVTTTADGSTLVDTDQGETAGATEIGTVSDQNSYGNTGDNTLAAMGDDGSIVTLDDNSVWAVNDPSDQATVQGWSDSDDIVVRDNGDGSYTLVDTYDQSSVTANYVGNE